jgi:hypothetical protein
MVASVRLTAVPRRALVPAAGFRRMTVPDGKAQFPLRVIAHRLLAARLEDPDRRPVP